MSVLNGSPVQVVTTGESESGVTFTLNDSVLESITLRQDVRDKKVVIISVAGAFRQGKSFFLNFLLRFITQDPKTWLTDKSAPLKGFSWRGGAERETTGIWMWSEPYLVTLSSGETVAVLFMDTQGAFDSSSTVRQCATVFALSTMLSSTQIYNIHSNIQEDHLQQLHLFSDYGQLAMQSSTSKPFQQLLFLVRDWSYAYDHAYGFGGGKTLLGARLKIHNQQHKELQSVRKHIHDCFSQVDCFLLPHPGLPVASNFNFDGRLSDIEPEFIKQLEVVASALLSPSHLNVKMINGDSVTCSQWLTYFKQYMQIYQSDELPEPRSILVATAEANNLNALIECRDWYIDQMNQICGPDKPYINPDDVNASHDINFSAALRRFKATRRMGGEEFSAIYLTKLEQTLIQLSDDFREANRAKDVFQAFRTPAILCVILLAAHIVNSFTLLIGLSLVSDAVGYLFYLVLTALLTWFLLRYLGKAPEVAKHIDQSADVVVEKAFLPAIRYLGQRGIGQWLDSSRLMAPSASTTNNQQRAPTTSK